MVRDSRLLRLNQKDILRNNFGPPRTAKALFVSRTIGRSTLGVISPSPKSIAQAPSEGSPTPSALPSSIPSGGPQIVTLLCHCGCLFAEKTFIRSLPSAHNLQYSSELLYPKRFCVGSAETFFNPFYKPDKEMPTPKSAQHPLILSPPPPAPFLSPVSLPTKYVPSSRESEPALNACRISKQPTAVMRSLFIEIVINAAAMKSPDQVTGGHSKGLSDTDLCRPE